MYQPDDRSPTQPRVFDCFMFSDELLLLEFRLRLLDPVVDRFVIVEADRTFQGSPKPLHFLDNRTSFEGWEHKITHVVVRDLPATDARWERERHQRRAILRGLAEAGKDDIVIVSDVDEMPDPDAVRRLHTLQLHPHVALDMQFLNYCVDLEGRTRWRRAKVCLMRDLVDPEALRNARPPEPVMEHAGWHLSWLLPEQVAIPKLESYSHTEHNRPHLKSPRHIRRCRELGVGLAGGYLLWPIREEEIAPPLRALAVRYPELLHGPRGPWKTLLARCYLLNIWSTRFLPFALTDRHPLLTFMVAAVLRVATYPLALVRRAWRRRQAELIATTQIGG